MEEPSVTVTVSVLDAETLLTVLAFSEPATPEEHSAVARLAAALRQALRESATRRNRIAR